MPQRTGRWRGVYRTVATAQRVSSSNPLNKSTAPPALDRATANPNDLGSRRAVQGVEKPLGDDLGRLVADLSRSPRNGLPVSRIDHGHGDSAPACRSRPETPPGLGGARATPSLGVRWVGGARYADPRKRAGDPDLHQKGRRTSVLGPTQPIPNAPLDRARIGVLRARGETAIGYRRRSR